LREHALRQLDFGPIPTEIPGVVSQVQSGASSIANAIPGSLRATIPKNCSIGTGKFCIGFDDHVSCDDLPLNISNIIPPEITNLLSDDFNIEALETAASKITEPYIQRFLVLGLALQPVAILIFIFYIYWFSVLKGTMGRALWAVIHVFGVISFGPFVLPVAILSVLGSKTGQLPSWIQAQQGDVYELSIGCLCSAITIAIMGFIVWIIF